MKLQFKKRRLIPVALAIVVLVVGSGVAYAYWTSTGSGDGTAKAAASVDSLTVTPTPITNLYPGQDPQPIGGTLGNTNPGPVFVASVSATIDSVDMASGHSLTPDCTKDDFLLSGTATVGADVPGAGSLGWGHAATTPVDTMTIRLQNLGHNQDACKGATVNLKFTIS